MAYGMMDASDITLINKATKKVFAHIDYANTTTTEWSSDRVYATKKGNNAIAWDAAKKATLKLSTELFDLKLLALAHGSELSKNGADLFKNERYTLTSDKTIKLFATPEAGTISVYKLKADMLTHDGDEVPMQATGEANAVPVMPEDVSVTAKGTTATITWSASKGATSYVVMRDGQKVGQPMTTTYTDSDLTPETPYKYTVIAINTNGQSPTSAKVAVTTTVNDETTGDATVATEEAKQAAQQAAAAASDQGLSYKINETGALVFSDHALVGESYVVYYVSKNSTAQQFVVSSNKFADSFEIYGDAHIRDEETGEDIFAQIYYPNAKPQASFTFTQSAKEPTALEITFDIMPNKDEQMAIYSFIV